MSQLLIVSSTVFEIADFLKDHCSSVSKYHYKVTNKADIHVLITGMGIANMTLQLSRFLNEHQISGAINTGFCGSFSTKFPPGSIVQTDSDCFAELGTLNEDLTIRTFADNTPDNEITGQLNMFVKPDALLRSVYSNSPMVRGITVSSCTNNSQRATFFKLQFEAETETMEGAAFYLCCNAYRIPCVQLRAVSNFIPSGGKVGWDVPRARLAIRNLLKEVISNQ